MIYLIPEHTKVLDEFASDTHLEQWNREFFFHISIWFRIDQISIPWAKVELRVIVQPELLNMVRSEQDHWRQASNAEYISDMGGDTLWICTLHFAVLVANVSSWADLVVVHPSLSHCCMHELEPPILSWEAVGLVSSEQQLRRFSVWSPAQNFRVCLISSHAYEFPLSANLKLLSHNSPWIFQDHYLLLKDSGNIGVQWSKSPWGRVGYF